MFFWCTALVFFFCKLCIGVVCVQLRMRTANEVMEQATASPAATAIIQVKSSWRSSSNIQRLLRRKTSCLRTRSCHWIVKWSLLSGAFRLPKKVGRQNLQLCINLLNPMLRSDSTHIPKAPRLFLGHWEHFFSFTLRNYKLL